MSQDVQIQLFESAKVRYLWDEEKQQYFFSVVDVIQVLTDSNIPRRYWSDLKRRLQAEGSEVYENIVQLTLMLVNYLFYSIKKKHQEKNIEQIYNFNMNFNQIKNF